jgi:hypothetical protein
MPQYKCLFTVITCHLQNRKAASQLQRGLLNTVECKFPGYISKVVTAPVSMAALWWV